MVQKAKLGFVVMVSVVLACASVGTAEAQGIRKYIGAKVAARSMVTSLDYESPVEFVGDADFKDRALTFFKNFAQVGLSTPVLNVTWNHNIIDSVVGNSSAGGSGESSIWELDLYGLQRLDYFTFIPGRRTKMQSVGQIFATVFLSTSNYRRYELLSDAYDYRSHELFTVFLLGGKIETETFKNETTGATRLTVETSRGGLFFYEGLINISNYIDFIWSIMTKEERRAGLKKQRLLSRLTWQFASAGRFYAFIRALPGFNAYVLETQYVSPDGSSRRTSGWGVDLVPAIYFYSFYAGEYLNASLAGNVMFLYGIEGVKEDLGGEEEPKTQYNRRMAYGANVLLSVSF